MDAGSVLPVSTHLLLAARSIGTSTPQNHDCERCDQKVHSKDRHVRNCVVIFQVALAASWHQAGRPEQETSQDVHSSACTKPVVRGLLQEPMEPAKDAEKPLLKFLERHCSLCDCDLANQQD